ncbi:hypothetical protein SAMN05444422_103191 [Halobiforma haloterrestris]|uniref:Uncharacterized protein n=1 Tax=Natronobacterium haloterrestre TaxID=148448 RepID=A0A1I1F625_NATHA|nr:hypothetical protein [Halobiforma haloterrestris]SFB94774.1 hypothetical protein SAMN05444422_103191 [Halobiforma haloterrestris]
MIGAYTVGKKAVQFGYKRYGVPGAVVSGGVALAGFVAVRRALRSATNQDEDTLTEAIDAQSIENAVDEGGLGSVADVETLENAIDADRLREGIDLEDVQSSVSEETSEFTDDEGDTSP